jgi:thiol:disulfide interchange protein
MPILETIAAANAAYSVIRTCIQNGRETADLMSNVGKFLTAEEELKDAVQKKKNSPITAITGGAEGDWEEFQQLEKIKEQRKELESYIRLYGQPGQWDRWQQWQMEARKARQAAKKAAEKAHQERMEAIQVAAGIILAITACVLGIYYLGVYLERW